VKGGKTKKYLKTEGKTIPRNGKKNKKTQLRGSRGLGVQKNFKMDRREFEGEGKLPKKEKDR